MKRIAILGAGFGGMAAAYDLARASCQVTIYEAADAVGGLASGFKESSWDWSVEKFYHHWFASDRHMLSLIDELGWRERVIFRRPYTVMYHQGKFYPFDSILAALLFPGLGWGLHKSALDWLDCTCVSPITGFRWKESPWMPGCASGRETMSMR